MYLCVYLRIMLYVCMHVCISGGVVGIDFGHAFGTATQFLPIPELVPFRLTAQFTYDSAFLSVYLRLDVCMKIIRE